MSVRTVEGVYDGDRRVAVMVDSVSGFAFGPLFDSTADVDSFVAWCEAYVGVDVRALDHRITACVHAWQQKRAEAETTA